MRAWVTRRGGTLLFFSRFLFGFRTAIPAACGVAEMSGFRFLWLNVAGAILWVLTVGLGGHLMGHIAEALYQDIRSYEWLLAGILLVGVFAVVAWRSRGRELKELGTLIRRPEQLASESWKWISDRATRQ